MKRVSEVIKTAELLMAGRYYNDEQKERIIRLVAGGFLLTEQETDDVCAFCLNPDYRYCDSLLRAKNGLVFLSGKVQDEERERALLEARKTIFESFEKSPSWEDREGWIRYVRSGGGFDKTYERALFYYAIGRTTEAAEIFRKYAADYHVLSLRLCISFARAAGDEAEETRLLAVLQKVLVELQFLDCPRRERERLEALCRKGYESVANAAYEESVHYFDGNGRTIGFGV